jgi:D-amino-acid dehydrogenase
MKETAELLHLNKEGFMNEGRADVLVIGAGVVGLSVAYFAALKGAKVLILEKGEVGSGSSSGNAGLLVHSYFEPLPAPGIITEAMRGLFGSEGFFRIQPRFDPSFLFWLLRFSRFCNPRDFEAHSRLLTKLNNEALGIHLDFAARSGESYEFSRKGLLFLYINNRRWEESQRRALRASEFGLETQILSGDEARHEEPALGDRVVGGVRYLSDAGLNPLRFIEWLAKSASALGAGIMPHCEVYGFRASGKKLRSVLTTKGEFQGDQLVLAAGAWLKGLGRLLGVHLPVEGGKGISQTFRAPPPSLMQPLILDEHHVAVSPLSGALRVTGLLELSGTDLCLRQRQVEGIRQASSLYLPVLKTMTPNDVWRGLRPCTPDGLPLLGKLKAWNNVFVAGGHDTKGMTLGPLTGELMSRLLEGREPREYGKELSPGRYGA